MDQQTGILSKIPDTVVPPSITLSNFTAARLKEIQAMRKSLSENSGTKMAFQKIPRHMRRRTMSHVVKRLPRRIREIHMNQMKKSGLPPKSKRPSRKHRRRPSNLLSDYVRRQRRIKWLDTHIWHAKRFHMIEKWGYKLPKQPCDKSFRACYRATAKHCLIQDLSYVKCIEIRGVYEEIMSKLERITDKTIGLTFAAKSVHSGKKYGQITIFEPANAGETRKPIGQVDYVWNSLQENSGNLRQLWLFVHPSFYKSLYELLSSLYEVYKIDDISDNSVVLKELEYDVGRFRLTGPLSTAVLKNAFRVIDFKGTKLPEFLSSYHQEVLSNQNEVFTELTNGSYIPPNTVLSVIVHDPRLSYPKKRTKALLEDTDNYGDTECFQENLAISPLFDDSVRKFCNDNKISNAHLCKIRSLFLIPEEGFSISSSEAKIPVILLWRTGNKSGENQGYSHGWDVIVPSSYSQAFFLTFIMWGARAGGLRETESIAFERSQTDILYPDTVAGEQEENSLSEKLRETFFRLPPNKRTNFNKFSIVSPYCFNWKLLIKDWSGKDCQLFSVIRNRNLLNNIQSFLSRKRHTLDDLPSNCLVPIKVVPVLRGVCSKFSVICIPTEADLKVLPVEPKKTDLYAQKRKKLRLEHRSLLQKLRRRRKRARSAGKPVTPTDVKMLREYQTEMRSLWLPEPETIRNSCSRPVMGFIKHGGFSYTLGQSKGLGYIAANSLQSLGTLGCRNKVLIRPPNSRVYRLAIISVVVD
ncbi:ribonucleases P/MRP protein subunit POP1 [Anthonomus grandis grandis]|uniref:ribonucleases P/MRP protein subunit POP1 n=1 Tax=Anthonomus grandis grandis TaxID=2921223 RepID=UPI002165D72E|nr:ribonucleases P/MRP protein subunit POP1 [Anthonomus grandis grandis]